MDPKTNSTGTARGRPEIEFVAEKAARLVELVRGFPIAGIEGSYKMSRQSLLSNRLMIGLSRSSIEDDAILAILHSLNAPAELLKEIVPSLPPANLVLFGFEDGDTHCLYKFYLEYWDRLVEAVDAGVLAPALLHLGFKWSAATGERIAVTRYSCFPMLTHEDILERVRSFHRATEHSGPLGAVKSILHAAFRRANSFVYLEGEEEGSPRRSYDVNLYAAELKLRDIASELAVLRDYFAIPVQDFGRLFDRIGEATLGHISGGTGRAGEDFVTFYYDMD